MKQLMPASSYIQELYSGPAFSSHFTDSCVSQVSSVLSFLENVQSNMRVK